MSGNEKKSVVIALGFFDCVHIGHRAVIGAAIKTAKKYGAVPAVFTFDGNLKEKLLSAENKAAEDKTVFTPEERKDYICALGVHEIFFAPVSFEFLNKTPSSFLDYLNEIYTIKGYVCGEDYRFGKGGEGDTEFLKGYARSHSQSVEVIGTVILKDEKVSTTKIKSLLSSGEVEKANELLGASYFVKGVVFEDRKVGTAMGFPTINVKIAPDKLKLKDGVYGGHITVGGKFYKTIINYGARPTFSLSEKLVEAHIADYSGKLYGKTVTLYFDFFMRENKKFDGVDELKAQLSRDLQRVKEAIYD